MLFIRPRRLSLSVVWQRVQVWTRERWPAACILCDHSPRTIDTLHWAHKEPHTPGRANKESFETLRQGKCATPGHLDVTSYSLKTQMFMTEEKKNEFAVMLKMLPVLLLWIPSVSVFVWKYKGDVLLMFSLFFFFTCYKERAHCWGESQVQNNLPPICSDLEWSFFSKLK